MTVPTPRATAPRAVRSIEQVASTMLDLEGVEDLPLAEQTSRLNQAQQALAAVLNHDASGELASPPDAAR